VIHAGKKCHGENALQTNRPNDLSRSLNMLLAMKKPALHRGETLAVEPVDYFLAVSLVASLATSLVALSAFLASVFASALTSAFAGAAAAAGAAGVVANAAAENAPMIKVARSLVMMFPSCCLKTPPIGSDHSTAWETHLLT
jgi:hypothetical protein